MNKTCESKNIETNSLRSKLEIVEDFDQVTPPDLIEFIELVHNLGDGLESLMEESKQVESEIRSSHTKIEAVNMKYLINLA